MMVKFSVRYRNGETMFIDERSFENVDEFIAWRERELKYVNLFYFITIEVLVFMLNGNYRVKGNRNLTEPLVELFGPDYDNAE